MFMYSAIFRGTPNDVAQNRRIPRNPGWETPSQPLTMGIIVEGTESNYNGESIYPCCMF